MANDEGGGARSDITSGVMFIFIVLLFLIAVWFLTGGPKKAGTIRNIFLSPPAPFGTSSYIGVPSVNFNTSETPSYGSENDGGVPQSGITNDLTDTQSISLGLKNLPTSPYAGKVRLSAGGGAYAGNVKEEYVILRANSNNLQKISISGWKLQSAINKKTAVIYQGVSVYEPALSQPGESIVLNPGDTAIVSSGRSPVGVSFKTNLCSGYLSQYQEFYPRLGEECPLPVDEAENFLYGGQSITDTDCLHYLQGIPQCRLVINPRGSLSDSCRTLINSTLTYNGCLSHHMSDADFKKNEWRIYLGYSEKLWRSNREVLTLLDADGKLVDSIVF